MLARPVKNERHPLNVCNDAQNCANHPERFGILLSYVHPCVLSFKGRVRKNAHAVCGRDPAARKSVLTNNHAGDTPGDESPLKKPPSAISLPLSSSAEFHRMLGQAISLPHRRLVCTDPCGSVFPHTSCRCWPSAAWREVAPGCVGNSERIFSRQSAKCSPRAEPTPVCPHGARWPIS